MLCPKLHKKNFFFISNFLQKIQKFWQVAPYFYNYQNLQQIITFQLTARIWRIQSLRSWGCWTRPRRGSRIWDHDEECAWIPGNGGLPRTDETEDALPTHPHASWTWSISTDPHDHSTPPPCKCTRCFDEPENGRVGIRKSKIRSSSQPAPYNWINIYFFW